MSHEEEGKVTKWVPAENKALFGPPPVLSSENVEHYHEIWDQLTACLMPNDFMEQLLIRTVVDTTWDAQRYTRQRTLSVERRFRQHLEFQVKRSKDIKERRDQQIRHLAEKMGRPESDVARLIELDEEVVLTIGKVDEILDRIPTELDHARALESAIGYHEQLERLINGALARRDQALAQLEYYREGLGQLLRKESDKIIDSTCTVVEAQASQIEAPPLAPTDDENKS